ELTTDNNGGENFTGTTFDDEAGIPITAGDNPYTGRFQPEQTLSFFDGEDPNGVWTLEINDDAGLDSGTLLNWTLSITTNVLDTVTAGLTSAMAAIPVVTQEQYFIRVVSANDQEAVYDLEIENFAAPAPAFIDLAAASDTGMMDNDNVTSDTTPTFFIQADLIDFSNMGIDLLNQSTIDPNNNGDASDATAPGAGVYVTLVNLANGSAVEGFANAVGTSGFLWSFTPTTPLSSGDYFVSGAVQIVDGQTPNATDRTQLGDPLTITIDTQGPEVHVGSLPDMLAASDSGMFDDDNVTNKMSPAFQGTTDPNSKVRIYAQRNDTAALLDQQQTTSNTRRSFDSRSYGQTFIPSTSGLLDRVDVRLGNSAVGAVDVTMEIFETAGGFPVGPALATTVVSGADIPTFSSNVTFDFGEEAFLDAGTQYAFVVTPSEPGINLFYGIFDPYAGGTFIDSPDGAAPWSSVGDSDLAFNTYMREPGPNELVGQSVATSQGDWEITSEPLVDGKYTIYAEYEDLAGNITVVGLPNPNHPVPVNQNEGHENGEEVETLMIVIDTEAPNTPYLDLIAGSDTGRSDEDNITNDETPTFTMTSEDPNVALAELLGFTDNLKFRVYDRFENTPEFLIYDSTQDTMVDDVLTPGDMFTAQTLITETFASQFVTLNPTGNAAVGTNGMLNDGVHNLKLEVEDRAGNTSDDFLLTVVIDTEAPNVTIQNIDQAATDTGVQGSPETFNDNITSDTATGFVGRAEADAIVRLYVDAIDNNSIDNQSQFSLTVAQPFDGNDAFPNGQWNTAFLRDLNNPNAPDNFPLDGLREVGVTAQDVAGNVSEAEFLDIFIDTQGPQIDSVHVISDGWVENNFNLFGLKGPNGEQQGPTPLVDGLSIEVQDMPERVAQFLYDALQENGQGNPVENIGNYQVVGDHVGIVAIDSVLFNPNPPVAGQSATGRIMINFMEPLADDRYTLTISDHLMDPAGNRLDGESNANEPNGDPEFPSGDGIPGGDFVARFTVDTRPEIGSFIPEGINIDINGNFVWDPATGEIGDDATNDDLTFTLPVANPDGTIGLGGYTVHDLLFAGKFAPGESLIIGDDAVFIIDVSGSTRNSFGGDPVGDQNNDGAMNQIIDAEIAAFKAFNQDLIDRGLGNTAQVGIVAFDSSAMSLDMDPVAAGVQLTTTPLADANNNGMRDVDEVLMTLDSGGSTNYAAALSEASNTVTAIGQPNVNVIFLSDGRPNTGGPHADEVATLLGQNTNLRAFGVGPGVQLSQLQIIDPMAVNFSNTNELLGIFGGGGIVGLDDINGFDQLAAYGNSQELGDQYRWIIDTNSDGVVNPADGDIITIQPLLAEINVAGAIPIAANFSMIPQNGGEEEGAVEALGANGRQHDDLRPDVIGLYNLGVWAFDTNQNYVIDPGDTFASGDLFGQPIVGDFDGNGVDDLGVFNADQFFFDLSFDPQTDNTATIDDSLLWGFPGVLDRPVAADMNQDGIDDIGLWVPRANAQNPEAAAEWYFLISQRPEDANIMGTLFALDHPFEPDPFGNDLYAEFGNELAAPIVGNFDPPVADASDQQPAPNANTGPTPVEREAIQLDHDFELRVGNEYLDWGGINEKWIQGADGTWYFITPNGDFHLWHGRVVTNSTRLTTLSADYYDDLSLLGEAADQYLAAYPDQADQLLAVQWDQMYALDAGSEYLNWGGWHEKWILGSNSNWFFITPNGDFYQWHGGDIGNSTHLGALDGEHYDDLSLLHQAHEAYLQLIPPPIIPQLDPATLAGSLGLIDNPNYHYDWGGWKEKWIQGAYGAWYFILDTGELYRWHGGGIGNSSLLGTLDTIYYDNLELLFATSATTAVDAAFVALEDEWL
ncbi:MAG: Ig-like domain-containing protein, partial [Pirellulales bacterium]|nr:Ig-like domain-containing protein [Pirellulales bacterium]